MKFEIFKEFEETSIFLDLEKIDEFIMLVVKDIDS